MEEKLRRTSVLSPLLLSSVGLLFDILGLLSLVLAVGIPYWVYFDETLRLADSGATYDVELVYHYGFWSYCREITTVTSSARTCAAAKTSSGAEQMTVCILLLACVFSTNSIVNVCLYLRWFQRSRISLLIAITSDVLAGSLVASGALYFSLQNHSYSVTNDIIFHFSTANLHASFWLTIASCICIGISTVTTFALLIRHKRPVGSTKSTRKAASHTSSTAIYSGSPSTSQSSLDRSDSVFPSPNATFCVNHTRDGTNEEQDDLLNDKHYQATQVQSLSTTILTFKNKSSEKTPGVNSQLELSASLEEDIKTNRIKSRAISENSVLELSVQKGDNRANGKQTLPLEADLNETNGAIESRDEWDKTSSSGSSYSADENRCLFGRQTMRKTVLIERNTAKATFGRSEKSQPDSGKCVHVKPMRSKTELLFLATGGQTTFWRKHDRSRNKRTKEQRKLDALRLQRARSLINVYTNPPYLPVGVMGSIPRPKPLASNLKTNRPSSSVLMSGKKFMASMRAYRTMRFILDKKHDILKKEN